MPSVRKSKRRRCSFRYERKLQKQGFLRIAGVDEVGRGALCGPVVAAAIIFDRRPRFSGIRDSKALTAIQRTKLQPRILRASLSSGIGIVSAEEIDRYNIYQATLRAMHIALSQLNPAPDFILIDGSPVRGLGIPHLNVVKGDARCITIAAASIVAKVTRDHLMKSYASMYPKYDWVRNKGYSCKSHFAALKNYGPTSIHRRSFRPVLVEPQLSLIDATEIEPKQSGGS
jgi:ribonuclease HII